MSKRLMYLIGILLTILLGTYFSWILCCPLCEEKNKPISNETESVTTKVAHKDPTLYPFSIKDDNGDLSLKANDNFNFEKSNLNFLNPISSNLDLEIDKLKEYLGSKDNKSLSITGYYTDGEKNSSLLDNLGLARANSVKNYFANKGIPSKIMNIFGQKKKEMIPDSLNVYHGPLGFTITELKDNTEEIAKLGEYIKANPIVLKFNTGKFNFNLTEAERQEMADIIKYLDKVDGAMCLVIGHTDNSGSSETNLNLGQKRADKVKKYLIKNGIPAGKIIATSKGETEPIADNNTEEGKAENRRTVITIK